MTNGEIRAWYQERIAQISKLNAEWISQGISLKDRADRAWRIRHDARIEARWMMENPIEIEDLRERDRRLYGNPDGPTFDQLVEDNHRRGLEGDEVYEQIIGSQTTNREVNKHLEEKRPPH